VDTGKSAVSLVEELKKHSPKSIRFSTLLIKKTARRNDFRPDCYLFSFLSSFFFFSKKKKIDIGFAIPDSFVVGYALDYNEYFRDLDVHFFSFFFQLYFFIFIFIFFKKKKARLHFE